MAAMESLNGQTVCGSFLKVMEAQPPKGQAEMTEEPSTKRPRY